MNGSNRLEGIKMYNVEIVECNTSRCNSIGLKYIDH